MECGQELVIKEAGAKPELHLFRFVVDMLYNVRYCECRTDRSNGFVAYIILVKTLDRADSVWAWSQEVGCQTANRPNDKTYHWQYQTCTSRARITPGLQSTFAVFFSNTQDSSNAAM